MLIPCRLRYGAKCGWWLDTWIGDPGDRYHAERITDDDAARYRAAGVPVERWVDGCGWVADD